MYPCLIVPAAAIPGGLRQARAAACEAVELVLVPPVPARAAVQELCWALQGTAIAAVSVDLPDLSRAEEEGGLEAVEQLAAAIHLARALGAPVVATRLGSTEIEAWDAAWERTVSGLQHALRTTRRAGVRVAVALGGGDVLDSLKKARRLLETIPDPRLGIVMDAGTFYWLRLDFAEALRHLGERVYHVRLTDGTRSSQCLEFGAGEVRYLALLRLLRRFRYRQALALGGWEHSPAGDIGAAAAATAVREWLAALPAEPSPPPVEAPGDTEAVPSPAGGEEHYASPASS